MCRFKQIRFLERKFKQIFLYFVGLMDPSSPCCVTWGNGTSACIPELVPCRDADKHYFWDGYHLTETVYRVIATKCFNDTSVCIPNNIKELVEG